MVQLFRTARQERVSTVSYGRNALSFFTRDEDLWVATDPSNSDARRSIGTSTISSNTLSQCDASSGVPGFLFTAMRTLQPNWSQGTKDEIVGSDGRLLLRRRKRFLG